jgi:hypothetical protein
MKRIFLAILLSPLSAYAAGMECEEYDRVVTNLTTEESSVTARCPDNGNIIDLECHIYRGSGVGDSERSSFRSSKCNFIANYDSVELDVNEEEIEGSEKYDYDVRLTGLCCK